VQVLNKSTVIDYFSAPGPAELEAWCRENGYEGVLPTQDVEGENMPSDHVLAAALWYARTKHPNADNLDVCSFAGLVSYLATGWCGGFGTDQYEKERRAENIVLALAGCTPVGNISVGGLWFMPEQSKPGEELTLRVLNFLEEYYFQDEKKALAELMSKHALDMVRSGEVLTVSQVAKEYGLTDRTVRLAIRERKFAPDEVAETSAGWLVTRAAAERLWGHRREKGNRGVSYATDQGNTFPDC